MVETKLESFERIGLGGGDLTVGSRADFLLLKGACLRELCVCFHHLLCADFTKITQDQQIQWRTDVNVMETRDGRHAGVSDGHRNWQQQQ